MKINSVYLFSSGNNNKYLLLLNNKEYNICEIAFFDPDTGEYEKLKYLKLQNINIYVKIKLNESDFLLKHKYIDNNFLIENANSCILAQHINEKHKILFLNNVKYNVKKLSDIIDNYYLTYSVENLYSIDFELYTKYGKEELIQKNNIMVSSNITFFDNELGKKIKALLLNKQISNATINNLKYFIKDINNSPEFYHIFMQLIRNGKLNNFLDK